MFYSLSDSITLEWRINFNLPDINATEVMQIFFGRLEAAKNIVCHSPRSFA